MASLASLLDSEPADLPDGTVIDGLVALIDLSGRLGRAKVAKLLEARKDVEELFAEHEEALVGGEALKTTLEDWIDRRVKAGAIDPCDGRGRPGHRADALLALAGIAADHDNETGAHQPRARINLSWDADDLLGKDIAELAELDQRRCNTTAGTTLAFATADQLMCNADVHDLLVKFGYDNTRTILGALPVVS